MLLECGEGRKNRAANISTNGFNMGKKAYFFGPSVCFLVRKIKKDEL